MAFQTGTATGIDNLIDTHLKSFATGRGWTVNDDNWPEHLHISKGTVNISLSGDENNFNDAFSNAVQDKYVRMSLTDGYDGSEATPELRRRNQPETVLVSDPNNTAVTNNVGGAVTNHLTANSLRYWLFSGDAGAGSPDYIYMVVETIGGHYVHMHFGRVDTFGAAHTGGQFAHGTLWGWWAQSTTFSTRSDVRLSSSVHRIPFVQNSGQGWFVHAGDASPVPWTKVGGVIENMFTVASTEQGFLQSSLFGDARLGLGQSAINGRTSMQPLYCMVDNTVIGGSPAKSIFLGQYAGIRLISLKGRSAEDIVTIGSDDWYLFPLRRLQSFSVFDEADAAVPPAVNNTSFIVAFAYKRVNGG